LERQKRYNVENFDKILECQKRYRVNNSDKVAKYHKKYDSQYRLSNPGIFNAYNAKRRAAKLQRTPAWADLEAIKQIYADCAEINIAAKLAGCTEKFVVDHIIPC